MMKASQKVGDETPISEIEPRDVIDPAVAPHRGDDAERNADRRCDSTNATVAKLDRGRRVLRDVVQHRTLRRDRDAEVAVHQAFRKMK